MWTRSAWLPLTLSAFALGSSGCATSSTAVAPRAPAALLLPCQDPDLQADPNNPVLEAYVIDGTTLSKAYADCKRRDADKAAWIKGLQ